MKDNSWSQTSSIHHLRRIQLPQINKRDLVASNFHQYLDIWMIYVCDLSTSHFPHISLYNLSPHQHFWVHQSINFFPLRSYKLPTKSEVWGHDIDRSNEKVRLKELERLKAIGAIGSLTARWFPEMGKMKWRNGKSSKKWVGFMVWELVGCLDGHDDGA